MSPNKFNKNIFKEMDHKPKCKNRNNKTIRKTMQVKNLYNLEIW